VASLLRGEGLAREALYWHYPHYPNQGARPGGAIRAGDDKLIEHYEDGRLELYNVRKDPREVKNLVDDQGDVMKRLRKQLDDWRKEVGAKSMRLNPDYVPNPQAKDGTITLPARTARIHGVQVRYEPLPHKNTLGFWTEKHDIAIFEFTVEKPGSFTVEVLQGCDKRSEGAEVELLFGESGSVATSVPFTVKDTGGFQNFEAREVGTITIDKAGRQALIIKPKTKPGPAVMDLRQVVLKLKK
jgi:arylsulfatase A